MYLYFDKKGILKTKIDHGEPARQGNDLNITVCLDPDFFQYLKQEVNDDFSDDFHQWYLTASVQKADTLPVAENTLGSADFDSFEDKPFFKLFDSEMTYSLKEGSIYLMSSGTLFSAYSTNYGVALRINFDLYDDSSVEINEESSESEEIEATALHYELASVIVEVEKTYVEYRTNISSELYQNLLNRVNIATTKITNLTENYVKNVEVVGRDVTIHQVVDGHDEDVPLNDLLVTVDDELSTTSENPVQNKVITEALNEKIDKQFSIGYTVEPEV